MGEAARIYIADDENNIRSAIKTFLENAGYVVKDFENGDLLLAAFAEVPADLVVLDVMMPGSNGFVVCKELRKKSTVPIIMLTARDSDLDYATGLDLGSDDYLVKPFSPMALVKRVEAIFRRLAFDRKVFAELDLLTGLLDKVSGENQVETKLSQSNETSTHSLLLIDVDRLKDINDSFGRDSGDKVLIKISKVLSELFGNYDILCRFGGDEFLVLATDILSIEIIAQKAMDICAADKTSNASVSIGIAHYPNNGHLYGELLNYASNALAEAKARGGNGYVIDSQHEAVSQ